MASEHEHFISISGPYEEPREQIAILRVPTASNPWNALELHTKYRQNILCDFKDNVAVFRRLCAVMNLDILPQVCSHFQLLPTQFQNCDIPPKHSNNR